MLKLEIIGCSGGAPEPGGACSCYLVQGGGATVLLDCGPGALPRLAKRVAPEAVDAIILSHMHQDHVLDLLPYTRVLQRAGALNTGGPRVKLLAPPGGVAILRALASVFAKSPEQLAGAPEATVRFSGPDLFNELFDLVEYDPAGNVRLGGPSAGYSSSSGPGSGAGLEVSFVEMRHVGGCFGMRVTDGTGEHPGLDELARRADVLLCESTLRDEDPDSGGRHGHLTATQAGRAATRAGARRLLLTHFTRSDQEWRDDLAARAAAEFCGPLASVRCDETYVVGRERAPQP